MGRQVVALAAGLAIGACGDAATGTTGDATTTADTSTEADVAADTTPTPTEATHIETLVDAKEVSILLGGSAAIGFDVPAGTLAVTITVLGDGGSTFGLDSWVGPNDNELVYKGWLTSDPGAGQLCLECTNRITVEPGAFAAIAPNSPDALLEAGHHEVKLFGFTPAEVRTDVNPGCGDRVCHFLDQFQCQSDCAPKMFTGPVTVTVLAKVVTTAGATLPETGVMDLNLHFTGAQDLTAASAPTDPSFQADLASMRAMYAQVGITIDQVTYRDIDPKFKVIESIDGPDNDLQALYEQSAGNALNAIDLYFVDEISSASLGGFGVILGIAGGIPGPPLMQGTHRSGVAIAVKPVQGAPAGVDTTMAHETGHFLGLYHTSEQRIPGSSQVHDPLPDTPENDEDYLMFNTGAGSTLSPWQGIVMRENPWVRHPVGE